MRTFTLCNGTHCFSIEFINLYYSLNKDSTNLKLSSYWMSSLQTRHYTIKPQLNSSALLDNKTELTSMYSIFKRRKDRMKGTVMGLTCHSWQQSCITRIPVFYSCRPALAGLRLVRYRSEAGSIGPVQDRFWHVGARPYGHEKSNDDKTTLVAFQAYLLLGGGICDSGKLALADISTPSTSTEGESCHGAGLGVAGGIAGCQLQPLVPSVSAGWHPGGSLFFSVQNIYWEYIACKNMW